MTPEAELLRERTRLRVVSALSKVDLTWTELLKQSAVSRNTLSKCLKELEKQGFVRETLRRARKGRHPTVVYSLSSGARRHYAGILETVERFHQVEEKAKEYTSSFIEKSKTRKDIPLLTREYNSYIIRYFVLGILKDALLSDFRDPSWEALVATEALATLRRILFQNEFFSTFADEIVKNIEEVKKAMRSETLS